MRLARVALDVPLDELFDFLLPEGLEAARGDLVVVPFGRARKVGVVAATTDQSAIPASRLKAVERKVEDVPRLAEAHLGLLEFCAGYYQRALGEVVAASLPPRLRRVSRRPLRAPEPVALDSRLLPGPPLTAAQREAVAALAAASPGFTPWLLRGVTGSGKTEVYLQAIGRILAAGRQALMLVPEIGLTPQFEAHVRSRFPGANLVAAHSHMAEGERARAWLAAQAGSAHVVFGTRLAVLLPFRDLGLIVVDEEHDLSYKQQEGLRYSARDVAVWRAQQLGIPVVLGSATPSLESVWNAREGRYRKLELPARAVSGAGLPRIHMVDTRADRPVDGLTAALRRALRERLARGEQSLVFINRRGYAPVLYCRACTWHSACPRCSANLVLHRAEGRLRCHHCGHAARVPARCPDCGTGELAPLGHGTQRIEEVIAEAVPGARIARVDRDATLRRGALRGVLEAVREGEIDILVGTQMLAKGHDYPNLTLVGVLESDGALFSADFRAAERLYAQLTQVAGRAGRGSEPGEVIIQTHFPGHPLYHAVARGDFEAFAESALAERELAGLPPFGHLALLRAESKKAGEAMEFAATAARIARRMAGEIEVYDPVPAMLERKAGFERAQLLVRSSRRAGMQPFLRAWRPALAARTGHRVRWSLDVDPQEA